MVVFSVFDVSSSFDFSRVTCGEDGEVRGTTKKGDAFLKRKFRFHAEGKSQPVIVRFNESESWGMKEFKNDGGSKSYSFNVVLDSVDEERIGHLVTNLAKIAKKGLPKDLNKTTSFEKFSPVRNGNLYCRVPFNPRNQSFFCRFQDRKDIGRAEDFLNSECLVDAAIEFKSVYMSNGKAFLQLELLQVRKLEERVLLDYLGEYKPKETPHKAIVNKEQGQSDVESEYSSQQEDDY